MAENNARWPDTIIKGLVAVLFFGQPIDIFRVVKPKVDDLNEGHRLNALLNNHFEDVLLQKSYKRKSRQS